MIKVAILWHMHQPHYGDPETGAQLLPWVRLHASKDYLGMVEMLREFPGIRLTFNLVPSLIRQLDELARGRLADRYLDLARKPASSLTLEERAFIVANFFHAQRARMIEPWTRYRELLMKREDAGQGGLGTDPWEKAATSFDEGELRDLQVWQRLAWVDPMYAADARVSGLLQKGRGYTERDKEILDAIESEIAGRIIPAYRAAAARGQVELATSPFYHPILPLICDTDVYAQIRPEAKVVPPFRHPEDASMQVARAIECHRRHFGVSPRGLWPPEGAVSDAVVRIAAQNGFAWIATDEAILARTLGTSFARDGEGTLERPELLYRPYRVRVAGGETTCLFRDHVLSDLIGFTYSSWDPEAAAEDLVRRIVAGGRRYAERTGGEDATIPIILDGENAWEHYPGQGRAFLRSFYGRLAGHPEIRTVTMSEAAGGANSTLGGLVPGSWANGDFYIWIGHEDDRRAWAQLSLARQALAEAEAAARLGERALEKAREEMMIAEGSDWFWWYGDDHSSDQDFEYDVLFRSHVEAVYRALGRPAPEYLAFTNITVGVKAVDIVQPQGPIEPVVDGRADEEWERAGYPKFRHMSGAMRQSAPDLIGKVSAIRFGTGDGTLYVRVDMTIPPGEVLAKGARLSIRFQKPAGMRLDIAAGPNGDTAASWRSRTPDGGWGSRPDLKARAAAGEVLEIAMPLAVLRTAGVDEVAFYVTLERGDAEVGRYPGPVPITAQI
ncbi:MAG: glycoside hydrolase [Vicinamibacterales bacterium]